MPKRFPSFALLSLFIFSISACAGGSQKLIYSVDDNGPKPTTKTETTPPAAAKPAPQADKPEDKMTADAKLKGHPKESLLKSFNLVYDKAW
jgi:hypothetical protein